MDNLAQIGLACLNEELYTWFVDLFTQPDRLQNTKVLRSISNVVSENLAVWLEGKCRLLATGSLVEGVCVPDYGGSITTCRYDSDLDNMLCVSLIDVGRKIIEMNLGRTSHLEISEENCFVPSIDYPGFCTVRFPAIVPEVIRDMSDSSLSQTTAAEVDITDVPSAVEFAHYMFRYLLTTTMDTPESQRLHPLKFLSGVHVMFKMTLHMAKYMQFSRETFKVEEVEFSKIMRSSLSGPSIQTTLDFSCLSESPIGTTSCKAYLEGESTEADDTAEDINEQDMDIVPAITFRTWPCVAQSWLKRPRKWPGGELVARIKNGGFHVVAVNPKSGQPRDVRHLWRISFSRAELLLMEAIGSNESWCKQTYRILKMVIKYHLVGPKGVLASYHLKTIFLWTLEEHPPGEWTNKTLAFFFLKMLDKLLHCLGRRLLPHYFIPENNLFGKLNREALGVVLRLVSRIRRDPMRYITRPDVVRWDVKLTGITIEDMLAWDSDMVVSWWTGG